ncbi:MAG: hypothetical protein J2P59_09375, partial [Acidimicrobiales bacterium]|nr:hypothetical protein [Acidimicrobiales bacterium]
AEAATPSGVPTSPQFFGRIFPQLPPFAQATNTVRAALLEVGMEGGIMDAKDDLAAGPVALITDPTVNGNPTATNAYGTNPDNPTQTAGSHFFGQFIDHDITFDQTSKLGVPQNPLKSPNTRTPTIDADTVFGGGPTVRPDLYVQNADGSVGPKLKIGTGGVHEDLPRGPAPTFTAIVGDLRNDEQLMLLGLHCGMILFYNNVLDQLPNINPALVGQSSFDTSTSFAQFMAARQIALWHYQWLVVNNHLPQFCGQAVVTDVLAHGNRFFRPPAGDDFMPIEFSAAVYRIGHSQVRPSYRANFTSGTGDSTSPTADPFFGLIFDPNQPNFDVPADRDDLLGGFPAPRRYIGWQTFFDAGDGQVKANKKIDPTVSTTMFKLPIPAIPPLTQTAPAGLPQRNLLRQLTWELPSGQSVARAMGVPLLSKADLADIAGVYAPFGQNTPLWYYTLAEAKAAANGEHLGPMGGRIVAETLIGLLRDDPTSYLAAFPRFQPFLGTDFVPGPNPVTTIAGETAYTNAHFLHFAGVLDQGIYR